MGFIRKIEDIFERYIEGFSSRFAGGLQPVEIAKRLSRELENDKTVGVSQVYVPNQFTVSMSKEDYERLSPYGQAIRDELSAFVDDEAKRKGYTIVGKPVVEITIDEHIKSGGFSVSSHYSEPLPKEEDSLEEEPVAADTQVYSRVDPPVRHRVSITGLLTVVSGLDTGLQVEIGADRVNIGRREGNELPLTDMNTSRLHAYIVYEEGSHVLCDAKSLNGSYVNNQRLTRKRLNSGDRIKLGNTVILYEVK